MQYLEYDLKLMQALKLVRKQRGLKQINIANDLEIDRSLYCRIENGEVAISTGQLLQIISALRTNLHTIQTIADILTFEDEFNYTEDQFYASFKESFKRAELNQITKDEINSLFNEFKKHYSKSTVE